MNIFYIDKDPSLAAKTMVDSHVVKMILESAQLLSTAHRVLDGDEFISFSGKRKVTRYVLPDDRESILYSATHINHPSSVWVRQSDQHYNWLVYHFVALCEEYTVRYKKTHKSQTLFPYLKNLPTNIPKAGFTSPPCAMDDAYIISEDAVENYRNYYSCGKSHLHQWTNRPIPEWVLKYQNNQKRRSAEISV